MSEPRLIQRVNYTTYEGNNGSAMVRRNRTLEDTIRQYDRINAQNPNLVRENLNRYLRLADTFTRTLRAMSATGRPNPYGTMYRATRRNNR